MDTLSNFSLENAKKLKVTVEKIMWKNRRPPSVYANKEKISDLNVNYNSNQTLKWLTKDLNIKECKRIHFLNFNEYSKKKIDEESVCFYGWILDCLIMRYSVLETHEIGKNITKSELKKHKNNILKLTGPLMKLLSSYPSSHAASLFNAVEHFEYESEIEWESILNNSLSRYSTENRFLNIRELFFKGSNKLYKRYYNRECKSEMLVELAAAAFPEITDPAYSKAVDRALKRTNN